MDEYNVYVSGRFVATSTKEEILKDYDLTEEEFQAICKDKRKRTSTSNNSAIVKSISKSSETGSHIVEEIADVEIMLEQLKLLMDCNNEVEKVKVSKINRQLKRLGIGM